jgi:hypothetical protein
MNNEEKGDWVAAKEKNKKANKDCHAGKYFRGGDD